MPETTEFQAERAELEALLSSGVFHRAPHLASFLSYICERYFEGQAAQIKEYTIGVEALGRSPGFDPKKDSIVRVEAHRLRRRLSDYYATEGARHPVRILIPNGQYIPQFIVQNGGEQHTSVAAVASHEPSVFVNEATLQPPAHRSPVRLIVIAAVCVMSLIVLARLARMHAKNSSPPRDEIWRGSAVEPVSAEFRMLAGYHGAPFADRQGHTWNADAYFTGGQSLALPAGRTIEGLADRRLLRAQRSGRFSYDIPLAKGTYELHLYFVETEYGPGNPRGGGEASRIFRVSINDTPRLTSFDPLAESGAPNRLHERVFKDISPASDGKLHIAFTPSDGGLAAFVNALAVLPSAPGLIRPIRIVAQDQPVTDCEGHFWAADEYFSGGTLVLRRNEVFQPQDKALYRGERYGHFVYRIPLAPGKYRLTLRFAETWFGASGRPFLGSRVFNVFANGVALLRDFEIAQRASPNQGITMVFDDVQPDAQGVLALEFVPVKNYAEVNAIELVETG